MVKLLADIVRVSGRFHRSVNLQIDYGDPASLEAYLPTSTARSIAETILGELSHNKGTRAWSITGPYGSGKSAFGVFLADILCSAEPHSSVGQELKEASGLHEAEFQPVLLTAQRGPLAPQLLDSLSALFGLRGRFATRIKRLVGAARKGDGNALSSVLLHAAKEAKQRRRGGLLVIIDELGKFLESAAEDPGHEDVYILQQLAEAATRSDIPIALLTILHSGFADYLPPTEELRRQEWQKVQGRFHDIPFQLPAEQALELLASAIHSQADAKLKRQWETTLQPLLATEALSGAATKLPVASVASRCLPIHPVTLLLLWPLFRSKGAQNERSLFSWLTSGEPFAFNDFLRSHDTEAVHLYDLPQLYDYLVSSLGLGAFRGDQARSWSLIDEALVRLPSDAPEGSSGALKAIGLIALYGGQVGLKASRGTLECAVGGHCDLDDVLAYLQDSSRILFRRHLDAFGLWEGSDFDLEGAREEAGNKLRSGSDIAARLQEALPPRPYVPRKHYIDTGTLRTMDVRYVSPDDLRKPITIPQDNDGVFLVVVSQGRDGKEVAEAAKSYTQAADLPVVVAIPHATRNLEADLRELEIWEWIQSYHLELEGDAVARHEVQARLDAARLRLQNRVGPIVGLPGYPIDPTLSDWVWGGQSHSLSNSVALQRALSGLCDEIFHQAPVFQNELLNRRMLSSAASGARRTLLEAMVRSPTEETLSISGTPPEMSMYMSMLLRGGFHKKSKKGLWSLRVPSDSAWGPVCQEIERFLAEDRSLARPLPELIDRLKGAPYGLRDGPIPVLLAAIILAKGDSIALYEEGVFVPEIGIEILERLTRRPELFELRSQELSSAQKKAVKVLAAAAAEGAWDTADVVPENTLLAVVRSLVVFAGKLTPYAKQTKRLEPAQAVRVRDCLLNARDPIALLFEELPIACGFEGLTQRNVKLFVHRLQDYLKAMGRAYPHLLDQIESQVRTVFSLTGSSTVAARQLQQRAGIVVQVAAEPKLSLFAREASQVDLERDWRERIGRAVNGGMPPTHWRDRDATAFQLKIAELASDFLRLEELAAEQNRQGAPKVLRIGMLDGQHREVRAVIPIRDEVDDDVEALVARLRVALGDRDRSEDADRTALEALGKVAVEYMSQVEEERVATHD